MILKKEIRAKSNIISKQKKRKYDFKNGSEKTVSLYDFAYLSCFFVCSDSKLAKN